MSRTDDRSESFDELHLERKDDDFFGEDDSPSEENASESREDFSDEGTPEASADGAPDISAAAPLVMGDAPAAGNVKKKKKALKKKAVPALANAARPAEIPKEQIVFVQLPPTGRGRKKKRALIIFLILLLPAILGFIYFQFFASPMYVSHASFAIRNAEGGAPTGTDLASMFMNNAGSSNNDTYIVNDYIQSYDLAEDINKELDFVTHYSDPSLDIISRLWRQPTQDELTTYWHWAVTPELSVDTGIITVEVLAYTPDMAQKITRAVLSRSEALVNEMNSRAQEDSVRLSREEVARAEERVRKAQSAMRKFRDTHDMIDPRAKASELQSLVARLEAEASSLKTKISESQAFMQHNAPALVSLRQRLEAVEKQLLEERKRVAGESSRQGNLNAVVTDYEELALEADFAQRQLVSAMASLEQSRVQQISKTRYIVAFQQPTLPDESLYPRPFLFALYIFLGTFILAGILSLVWASIREHAGF